MVVLRQLLALGDFNPAKTQILQRLVKLNLVHRLKTPTARADVYWLVGQYCTHILPIAPDLLRLGVKDFISEASCLFFPSTLSCTMLTRKNSAFAR